MKRTITSFELGGSLYIPASHKDLYAVCIEAKYPYVRSVIIDFEDALDRDTFEASFDAFTTMLSRIPNQKLLLFVRPSGPHDTARFLALPHIGKLDGFVLPKCNLSSWKLYSGLLTAHDFWLMPVLETPEILHEHTRQILADAFKAMQSSILTLRFGGEDLSVLLGIKRQKNESLYDYSLLTHLLDSTVLSFAPLPMTAPVFTYYEDEVGFVREAREDLRHGLFGKTLIHPSQAKWLEKIYAVSYETLEVAQKLFKDDAKAIMTHDKAMLETIPHRTWAKRLMKRAEVYGVS